MNYNNLSLSENFHRYFDIKLASTDDLLKKAQRVRYRVYCEELAYEPVESFPDKYEKDKYDPQSLHILITHKTTGRSAGCIRLVKSVHQGISLLPLEKNFGDALDPEFTSRMDLERHTMCEISRLAIDPLFRRRHGEAFSRLGDSHAIDITEHEHRCFSLIGEALFIAAATLTELSGRNNIFALMEPYLARLLNRSGIYFMRIGQSVEHHGRRAPYYVTTESILDNLKPSLLDFYGSLRDNLAETYEYEVKSRAA